MAATDLMWERVAVQRRGSTTLVELGGSKRGSRRGRVQRGGATARDSALTTGSENVGSFRVLPRTIAFREQRYDGDGSRISICTNDLEAAAATTMVAVAEEVVVAGVEKVPAAFPC